MLIALLMLTHAQVPAHTNSSRAKLCPACPTCPTCPKRFKEFCAKCACEKNRSEAECQSESGVHVTKSCPVGYMTKLTEGKQECVASQLEKGPEVREK